MDHTHSRTENETNPSVQSISIDGLSLNPCNFMAEVEGRDALLTRVEFNILYALATREGSAVTRRWLVDQALDYDSVGNERTLDVHVSRLRKKLGTYGCKILTVWRTGYRFDQDAQ